MQGCFSISLFSPSIIYVPSFFAFSCNPSSSIVVSTASAIANETGSLQNWKGRGGGGGGGGEMVEKKEKRSECVQYVTEAL